MANATISTEKSVADRRSTVASPAARSPGSAEVLRPDRDRRESAGSLSVRRSEYDIDPAVLGLSLGRRIWRHRIRHAVCKHANASRREVGGGLLLQPLLHRECPFFRKLLVCFRTARVIGVSMHLDG